MTIDQATWDLWVNQGRNGVRGAAYETPYWDSKAIRLAVKQVNRGATLLDQTNPRWVNQILPGKLDMSDGTFCVIGQTYGDYDKVHVPFGKPYEWSANRTEASHGFMSSDNVPFVLLDRVWVYLLTARKQATTAHTPFYLEAPTRQRVPTPA